MTTNPETLASLVARAVDDDGITFVQLSERTIDPETGYQPSPNMLWKVARQKGVKVNPALVRAIAAGMQQLPLRRVQAAAAFEFTGYTATEVEGGTLVHAPGADVSDATKAHAIMARWAEEEREAVRDQPSE